MALSEGLITTARHRRLSTRVDDKHARLCAITASAPSPPRTGRPTDDTTNVLVKTTPTYEKVGAYFSLRSRLASPDRCIGRHDLPCGRIRIPVMLEIKGVLTGVCSRGDLGSRIYKIVGRSRRAVVSREDDRAGVVLPRCLTTNRRWSADTLPQRELGGRPNSNRPGSGVRVRRCPAGALRPAQMSI